MTARDDDVKEASKMLSNHLAWREANLPRPPPPAGRPEWSHWHGRAIDGTRVLHGDEGVTHRQSAKRLWLPLIKATADAKGHSQSDLGSQEPLQLAGLGTVEVRYVFRCGRKAQRTLRHSTKD